MNCGVELINVFLQIFKGTVLLFQIRSEKNYKKRMKSEEEMLKKIQDSINGSGKEDKQGPRCQMTSTASSP